MSKPTVDDYIEKGIYGEKELLPEERRLFLSTIRERVVMALKQSQVREVKPYKQVIDQMQKYKDAHLFVNGHMDYKYVSKYIKLANKHNIQYTIVNNNDYNSELGLVLAVSYAIEKEDIFVVKNKPQIEELENVPTGKQGLFSGLKKLFKRK